MIWPIITVITALGPYWAGTCGPEKQFGAGRGGAKGVVAAVSAALKASKRKKINLKRLPAFTPSGLNVSICGGAGVGVSHSY